MSFVWRENGKVKWQMYKRCLICDHVYNYFVYETIFEINLFV